MFEIVAGELRAKLGVDSAAMCARAGHEACEAKAGPDCGEESLAGFRANAPHISDTAPPVWRAPEGPAGPGRAIHSDLAPLVWRAPEGPAGLAAVLVGGGGAWPGFEPTRRAKLVARTARGRAATHQHTQRPGPTAPGTPARQQAPQAATQRKRAAARQGLRAFPQLFRTRHRRAASHSAQSSGQPLSAVERPRPRRPGRRSGQRPCAGCRQRQPG